MRKLIVVALTLSLAAVACGDDDPENNVTANNTTVNNTTVNNTTVNNTTVNNTTVNNTTVNNNPTVPSVTVVDQVAEPANEVTIATVVSDGPGWLVVHEADGESIGAGVGFAAVTDGTNTDVTVTLDRDVADGETLYAMLHTDSPADGQYTFPDDSTTDAPVAVDGDVVAPAFVVSVASNENSVTVEDQTLELSTLVTVSSANALVDGWMVIHEDDNGSPGPVIGVASVTEGANADIEVVLERPAEDGEILYAMLHVDTAPLGEYTFDGTNNEDVPATDSNDNVVVAPFELTVGATTPAVRFTVGNQGNQAYNFNAAEPAFFDAWISDVGGNNPTVSLQEGWRYEIVVENPVNHPFQLVTLGPARQADVVLLSQGAADGSQEGNNDINWVDDEATGAIQFTLTNQLNLLLSGYRCAKLNHINMRGEIVNP